MCSSDLCGGSAAAVERAGEGAVGRRWRWSGGGCGGSSAAVERAGEGAVGLASFPG